MVENHGREGEQVRKILFSSCCCFLINVTEIFLFISCFLVKVLFITKAYIGASLGSVPLTEWEGRCGGTHGAAEAHVLYNFLGPD